MKTFIKQLEEQGKEAIKYLLWGIEFENVFEKSLMY